jgi:hypothetical protein
MVHAVSIAVRQSLLAYGFLAGLGRHIRRLDISASHITIPSEIPILESPWLGGDQS